MSFDFFKRLCPRKLQLPAICFLVVCIGSSAVIGQTQKPGPSTGTRVASSFGFWLSVFPWGQQVFGIQTDVASPSILYATTNRGLFKTTNDGMTWQPVFLSNSNLTNLTLAQSKSSPSVMYLGIAQGQQGGVLKSTDLGGSWQRIGIEDIQRAVGSVQVDPSCSDTVYVVADSSNGAFICTRCVIYKSLNGGRTWGNVSPSVTTQGGTSAPIRIMAADPQISGHLVISYVKYDHSSEDRDDYFGRDRSNLWESKDGGLSWQHKKEWVVSRLNSADNMGVACNWTSFFFHVSDRNLLAGTADGDGWGGNRPPILTLSRDGGVSWQDIRIIEKVPFRNTAQMQSFAWSQASPDTVYAGTSESLYASSAFGQNWRRILPYQTTDVVAPASGDLYAVTVAGVLKSRNGGRAWHLAGLGLPTGAGVASCSLQTITSEAEIFVGCQGGFWTTSDSGLSWNWHDIGADPTPGISAEIMPKQHGQNVRDILVTKDNMVYLNLFSEGGARVIKLQQNGKVVNVDLRGKTPNRLGGSPTDPNTIYVTASEGFASWKDAEGGTSLLKSDDGGFSWQGFDLARWVRPRLAGESLANVPFFAVAPQSPNTVYAIVYLYDQRTGRRDGAFERTVDGGASWRDVFPDAMLNGTARGSQLGQFISIVVDPKDSHLVYWVFQHGVFRSPDGGDHWTDLPVAKIGAINGLTVSDESSRLLYVAADSGIWHSGDAGASWFLFQTGFYQQKAIRVLSGSHLTLAQGENGIYRLTDSDMNWLTSKWREFEDKPESSPIQFQSAIGQSSAVSIESKPAQSNPRGGSATEGTTPSALVSCSDYNLNPA